MTSETYNNPNFRGYQERKKRGRGGLAVGCFITLLLLVAIAVGAWILVLRPMIHQQVQDKVDQSMTQAINQIPTAAQQLPEGPIEVQERLLNNLLVLSSSPSSTIQKPVIQVKQDGVRLAFQVYSYDNAVTFTPQANKGQLTATNVRVEGPMQLVMSPEEIQQTLDKHFTEAQNRIKHPIQAVFLKDQAIQLQLGAPQNA